MKPDNKRILEVLGNVRDKQIAVIGDIMLDKYHWGNHVRMSPEAPVPVVDIESTTESLGGAANVLNNLYFLGAKPIMIGVVGDDDAGVAVKKKIQTENLPIEGIFFDSSRQTTVKERVISGGRHVVRMDWEDRNPISDDIVRKMVDYLSSISREVDAVIIQDYNKGVVTNDLITKVAAKCIANDLILTIDPKRENFLQYKKVTLLKPNVLETSEALGFEIANQSDVRKAGREILDRLECQSVLITQGSEGMTLFQKDGKVEHIESNVRKVADVSGAGDTVISAYTVALAAGATPVEAAVISNYAAGLVCEEVGVIPVEMRKLREYLENEIG